MCCYTQFLTTLFKYLIGTEDYNNNIIRKHSKNLDKLGEFSFVIDNLTFYVSNLASKIVTLKNNKIDIEKLANESKNWNLQVCRCITIKNNVHIFIERVSAYKIVIAEVMQKGCKYGSQNMELGNIRLRTDFNEEDLSKLSLTQLRMLLLKDVTHRLVVFNEGDKSPVNISIRLSLNLDKNSKEKVILCCPVLSAKDTVNRKIMAEEFYKKRTIDMRLMAEHKYGVRVTLNPGWQAIFEKLGHAAVTIELLQNKCNRSVTVNINDPTACSNKGASFILYNCARLATLFKEFDNRVTSNVYPALPPLDNVDFNLLNEPEEWEILYAYILQFPFLVNTCIKDILDCRINIHNLCSSLSGMCSVFSVYYRRVRVLTEPRSHLFATLHARIYLLKAMEQVLHNGLFLLNIQPVKQM